MSQSKISRRTLLRGVGAAVALPMFEAMLPLSALASTVDKAKPLRMAFVFVPNGINMAQWTPTATGAGFELPASLAPLKGVRDSLTILSGLGQHNAEALGDGPGDHARSAAAFLTGVHPKKTAGGDIHNGISADQLAAQKIGHNTKFASLEIGCERGGIAGDCDSGYSCAYSSNISWRAANTPVAKETNPRLVFERLFGSGDAAMDAESRFKRREFNRSVLDFVLEDVAQLRSQLGVRDQRKLDEYLTGVREIEQRLVATENAANQIAQTTGVKPNGTPQSYQDHLRLMGDMMVLAFQADLTRVGTFMFANEGSNRSYREIGVPEGHHEISHHGMDPKKLQKKAQIDHFHVEQFAYMLERMKAIKELDGTLLDHSMIVYGGGIGDGNRHNHDDLPVILAGRGGGTIKSGQHLKFTPGTPMNNLYLSLLDRMGVRAETLGDSTGKLRELL